MNPGYDEPSFKIKILNSNFFNSIVPAAANMINNALSYIISSLVGRFMMFKVAKNLPKTLGVMFEESTTITGKGFNSTLRVLEADCNEDGIRLKVRMHATPTKGRELEQKFEEVDLGQLMEYGDMMSVNPWAGFATGIVDD
jgi:hypothetical protein